MRSKSWRQTSTTPIQVFEHPQWSGLAVRGQQVPLMQVIFNRNWKMVTALFEQPQEWLWGISAAPHPASQSKLAAAELAKVGVLERRSQALLADSALHQQEVPGAQVRPRPLLVCVSGLLL